MKSHAKRRACIQLTCLVALVVFWTGARSQVQSGAGELIVTADFSNKDSVARNEPITLLFNRAIEPAEGKLAVLIGQTDVTSLLTSVNNQFTYDPRIVLLPEGESQVVVYLVSPGGNWKEVARLTLQVQPGEPSQSPPSQVATASPQPQAGGQRLGFDKLNFIPSLTVGMKSQPGESHFPDSKRPPRPNFADLTLQGSVSTDAARGLFNSQTQFDMVGTSFQQEALRFEQLGEEAPLIDISSYLMQFQVGKTKINVGHIAFGSNRHLINSFSSRGIMVTQPVTSRSDISLAVMSGTSIVGYSNFFGLNRRKHQIASGTFGLELISDRPGGLRVETSLVDGRLLPISNFNQGSITDAERSRGVALRVVASDGAQRLKLDAGFARSRFTNPDDPLLDQSMKIVPVKSVTRDARYLDASYMLLQNFSLSDTKKVNLTVSFGHEKVDPLFRSIAAFTQADRAQNHLEMVAAIGDITATLSQARFNDNLGNIPSILKSLSRGKSLIIGAPLVSVFGNAAKPSPWLPRVSYSYNQMHQFADSIPINGGFDTDLSSVPDQFSSNQNLTAEWQAGSLRFGYSFNRSFQDSQVGRELADLENFVNGFAFETSPLSSLDLKFDVGAESESNREANITNRKLRFGSNINWRMTKKMALALMLSTIGAGDAGRINRSRNTEFDLQWSYRFQFEQSRFKKVGAQFSIGYANRYARLRDNLFGLNDLTKIQTLNANLSFTFF